jgi:hypothetical protein
MDFYRHIAGYRTELPEEHLSTVFTEDSILKLDPALVGPHGYPQRRHHRTGS